MNDMNDNNQCESEYDYPAMILNWRESVEGVENEAYATIIDA